MKQSHSEIDDVEHELRSLLAGLKMACEQLAQDPGNQELVLAMARVVPKQADRLYLLTSALMNQTKKRMELKVN